MKKEELKTFNELMLKHYGNRPTHGMEDAAKDYAAQAVRYALSEAAEKAEIEYHEQDAGHPSVKESSILSLEQSILTDLK